MRAALLWAAAAAGALAAEYPKPAAGRAGRGRLEFVEGIPVLHLYGSAAEMGRQQGILLRRQFTALRKGYLDRFIGTGVARDAFLFSGLGLVPHMPDAYVAEMKALAKASGEPYANVLLANTFLDSSRAVRCSVVIATAAATRGGHVLFARNNDFPTLGIAHKASLLIVYHHEPGRARSFISIGWPGTIGVISGMNDAGLCVATLMSLSEGGAQPGMPYCMMYRRILEQCTTPQEALALVKKTRRTSANNLAVAGPKGEPLVIEFSATKVAARKPTRGILLSTNHFRQPEHVAVPRPTDGRYATLERLSAERRGRIDLASLRKMLRAVSQDMTLQSMIFEPAARRLHLAVGRIPSSDGPYRTINCARLLAAK